MHVIDSHLHIERLDAIGGLDAIQDRARAVGVTGAVAVGGNDRLNAAAVDACRAAPGWLVPAVGYDRDEAAERAGDDAACARAVAVLRADLAALRTTGPSPVAIGEIGLDYHYAPATAPAQRRLFATQLALARETGLPVIIHSRDADDDTLDILRMHVRAWPGDADRIGVLHCFTGGMRFARALLDLGLHISFSGIVTFRNADPLRTVAAAVSGERLLIETDSPFLAPVPVRGRQNEPAFVRHVAECLAAVRGEPVDDLARVTTRNARRLFTIAATSTQGRGLDLNPGAPLG